MRLIQNVDLHIATQICGAVPLPVCVSILLYTMKKPHGVGNQVQEVIVQVQIVSATPQNVNGPERQNLILEMQIRRVFLAKPQHVRIFKSVC